MLGKLARGAYVAIVAAMIVAWAVSATKSNPVEPPAKQTVATWWC